MSQGERSRRAANGFLHARQEYDGDDQSFVGLEHSLPTESDLDKVAKIARASAFCHISKEQEKKLLTDSLPTRPPSFQDPRRSHRSRRKKAVIERPSVGPLPAGLAARLWRGVGDEMER